MADSNWIKCQECEAEFHVLIDGGDSPKYCPNCGEELPELMDEEFFDEDLMYDDD